MPDLHREIFAEIAELAEGPLRYQMEQVLRSYDAKMAASQTDPPADPAEEATIDRLRAENERSLREIERLRDVIAANKAAFRDDHKALIFSIAEDMAEESLTRWGDLREKNRALENLLRNDHRAVEAEAERDGLRAALVGLFLALDNLDPSWREQTLGVGEQGDEVNAAWDRLSEMIGETRQDRIEVKP